jgi:hypothetical protein
VAIDAPDSFPAPGAFDGGVRLLTVVEGPDLGSLVVLGCARRVAFVFAGGAVWLPRKLECCGHDRSGDCS